MPKTRSRVAVVATVAALAALSVLAGCGSSGAGKDPLSPTVLAVRAIDPDREAPAAPVEGAVVGGTVRVMSHQELQTIDPTDAYFTSTVSILSGLMTRSLTQYVYDQAQNAMVLVPDIATDTGTPNDDFTQWTFTIRDGVRFEDGTEVTADDVAYGVKRSFDRATFTEGAAYSNDHFLDGATYQGPYRSGTSYPGVIVEGDTVTIKMAHPFPDMPYWAAFPAIGPIHEQGSAPATYRRTRWRRVHTRSRTSCLADP